MGNNDPSKNRNKYIDYLRGIASIGIVAIHTAFYAGQHYTPEWFWNITLLLDVPFFFYLSGWGSSYQNTNITKTCKSLGKIWLKWIYFITCMALFCFISTWFPHQFSGISSLKDLIDNYFFNVSIPAFPVIAGSIWYLPYYFIIITTNTIIMSCISKSSRIQEFKTCYLILLFVSFLWVTYDKYFFGLDIQYFLFYSFFWMLGKNRFGKINSLKKLIFCLTAIMGGVILCSYLQDLPLYDIQSAKFPPTMKYGVFSLFIIFIAKYFEDYMMNYNKLLLHIGQNAIFYYFAQGVGSSLNYYIADAIFLKNWFLKWIISFLINTFTTIIIAELLYITYAVLEKIILKVSNIAQLH